MTDLALTTVFDALAICSAAAVAEIPPLTVPVPPAGPEIENHEEITNKEAEVFPLPVALPVALLAAAAAPGCKIFSHFRKLPLIPSIGELFEPKKNFLRRNIVPGSYVNSEHYLDVQFRLLREDFLRSVKSGLADYLAGKPHHDNVVVHDSITLLAKTEDEEGREEWELKLPGELVARILSEKSKRFLPGSLLLFTNTEFKTTYFGLIRRPDLPFEESQGHFDVLITGCGHLDAIPTSTPNSVPSWKSNSNSGKFLTVECQHYFEPYRCVMSCLKRASWISSLSLWPYLQNGCGVVGPPAYLQVNTKLAILTTDPSEVTVTVPIDPWAPLTATCWPEELGPSSVGMDASQFRAFQAALTQEFTIIQGPPGTGKTFLGLQLIKTLMLPENQRGWRAFGGGPILVVCYTNHALDQFGDGLLDLFTPEALRNSMPPYRVPYPRIARLGMNCQSSRLSDYQPPSPNWTKDSVDIVLMTTTGAALRIGKLMKLHSKILLVEEAAQVLESHVVACLTPHTQHLVLLGDHQQLRPLTASKELTRQFGLDVSLFERMVLNNFPRFQLELQHRMRPEIRDLITGTIYPVLRDHPSVTTDYPVKVRGMAQPVFFLDHRHLESLDKGQGQGQGSMSKWNEFEARFLGALAEYLVMDQGYKESKVTVLGMYSSQVKALEKEIWGRRRISRDLRIETTDSFQGEENEIILLSLVRSNTRRSIGFMKTDNRICVALSRAKHGLFMIGNMELLASQSQTWKAIRTKLEAAGQIGPKLVLECAKHVPTTRTSVSAASDFNQLSFKGCSGCALKAAEDRAKFSASLGAGGGASHNLANQSQGLAQTQAQMNGSGSSTTTGNGNSSGSTNKKYQKQYWWNVRRPT